MPLNTLLSTAIYDEILRDSRASCLFVSAELYPQVAPILADNPFLRHVVVIGGEPPAGATGFTAFLEGATSQAALAVSADDIAFWLYSSGSTGRPKGVRHVHSSLRFTSDTYGAQVLGVRADDVVYSVAKIFFAYGLGNAMSFPMAVGATTLFGGRPTPEVVTDILATEKPTIFCGVPTLYAATLHHWESVGAPDTKALRQCISAGEALPAEVGRRWREITGVDILDGVGSTEMLHIFLSNRPGDVDYGTSGTAVPGYRLRLVDENGAETAPGTVGELLVSGASAADGWNQRDKSRATFEGSGPAPVTNMNAAPTALHLLRAHRRHVPVSGIWVSPFEVEQALMAHPAVLEAAVVAKRDDDGLEKPQAFIIPKGAMAPGATEEIKDFVERIGMWKYPRWIETVDDLPKTATEIQRFKLRDPAA